MSFYNRTEVKKTRRARTCDWCHETIEKGDPSIYTAGTFEGDFFTGRYHPECDSAAKRWYETNKCWGEGMPEYPMNRGGIQERGEPETNTTPSQP